MTQYRVSVCRCQMCGKQVRGQPPDVAPDQYGATAHRVGDRAMAAAHALHYGIGMPVRKVPRVLAALQGLTLTQGAITQDALRRAPGEVGAASARLRAAMPESPVVHPDDTSGRVGGEAASLLAFDTEEATVSQIRAPHRHEEVQEVMPPDDEGVMVTDRGRSDDAHAFDDVTQQKVSRISCARSARSWRAKKGEPETVGERLQALVQDAVPLWHTGHAGEGPDFTGAAQLLWDAVTHHLRPRILTDPDNQRLLNGIGRHHDRGNLRRCLADPRLAPTNNRAERVLRPAVIARKVSQCSKNTPGAQAFAACKQCRADLGKTRH